jgi:hypothetical protein
MIEKTKNYDLFKFRKDNRANIDKGHVEKIANSIKARNLLELKPILVNSNMEVIDGQHRLLAAKMLEVDIYYQINHDLESKDVIAMNSSKQWVLKDYLNYYAKNDYIHYKNLIIFMKTHSLSLNIALNILIGRTRDGFKNFKEGTFEFEEKYVEKNISICWDTVRYIKRINGFQNYTNTLRFWKALYQLVSHIDFDYTKWWSNLEKFVADVNVKARHEDYLKMFQNIYNHRNQMKIDLLKEEEMQ